MKVSFVNKVKFHIKKLYRKAKLPGDDSSQRCLMHLPESVIYT